MSYRFILALVVFCICPVAYGQDKEPAETKKDSVLKTDKEKDSYAIGMDIGNSIVNGKLDLDIALVIRAIQDVTGEKDTLLTKEEFGKQMGEFRKRMFAKAQERRKAEAAAKFVKQKKEGEDFLAANKKKDGVKVTDSGLQYKVIKSGDGATPTKSDTVVTHYRGTLIDGKEFDSSYKRGKPAEFPVGGVIAGWTEALQLMKEGDKWELYIPYNLAYGERGAGADIKPFSTLIFEIELIKVKK